MERLGTHMHTCTCVDTHIHMYMYDTTAHLTMSPSLTRRFCLTTLFIRIFSLATVSSDSTIHTWVGII